MSALENFRERAKNRLDEVAHTIAAGGDPPSDEMLRELFAGSGLGIDDLERRVNEIKQLVSFTDAESSRKQAAEAAGAATMTRRQAEQKLAAVRAECDARYTAAAHVYNNALATEQQAVEASNTWEIHVSSQKRFLQERGLLPTPPGSHSNGLSEAVQVVSAC